MLPFPLLLLVARATQKQPLASPCRWRCAEDPAPARLPSDESAETPQAVHSRAALHQRLAPATHATQAPHKPPGRVESRPAQPRTPPLPAPVPAPLPDPPDEHLLQRP